MPCYCREVDLRSDKTYKVHVSYMEIHNETLYDLLSDNPAASDNLSILDEASNTVVSSCWQQLQLVIIPGLSSVPKGSYSTVSSSCQHSLR